MQSQKAKLRAALYAFVPFTSGMRVGASEHAASQPAIHQPPNLYTYISVSPICAS
jgi:hypothetical protein